MGGTIGRLAALPAVLVAFGGTARGQSCLMSSPTFNLGNINPLYPGITSQTAATAQMNCSGFARSTTISACLQIGKGNGVNSTLTQRTISDSLNNVVNIAIYQGGGSTQIGTGSPYPLDGPISFVTNGTGSGTGSFPIGVSIVGPNGSADQNQYQGSFTGSDYLGSWSTGTAASCSTVTTPATTGYLTVNANVVQGCSVTASAMSFGSAAKLTTAHTATSTITLTCSAIGVSATVALDNGQTGTGPTSRYMTHAGYSIAYGIYQDSGHGSPWGQTAGSNTVAVSMLGSTQASVVAYGLVPVQSVSAAGTFTDVVNVNVTY